MMLPTELPKNELRLALAQMQVHPAQPRRNAETLIRYWGKAEGEGAHLCVFPEMALPGYLLGDAWERDAFLAACQAETQRLIRESATRQTAILFGTVGLDPKARGEDGRPRKYNAWVFAHRGEAHFHESTNLPFGVKTLQPNYREFDDTRYFYDTRRLAFDAGKPLGNFLEPLPFAAAGRIWKLGVHLCEDAWQEDYAHKPLDLLAEAGAEIFINLSASPFTRGKNGKRNRVFGALSQRLGHPMVYVNAVSLQNNAKTVFTFDGSSTVYRGDGQVALDIPAFETGLALVDLGRTDAGPCEVITTRLFLDNDDSDAKADSLVVNGEEPLPKTTSGEEATVLPRWGDDMPAIHAALRFGAETFLRQTGLQKVVIGVSGGIDSAVSAALFREFVKPENLLLVNMPSRFNSATTKGYAKELADRLGCPYMSVPIENAVAATQKQIDQVEIPMPRGKGHVTLRLEGLALENVQARDRGARLLAAIASAFGGVFVCNTNKAEMTVGYGTLYGDIAGFLAPIADLWKRDVYALGHYLNDAVYRKLVIPQGIFQVMPSAELSENQAVDEGKGDPLIYPYHDRLFFAFVQRWRRASPEDLLQAYLDGTLNQELDLPPGVDASRLFPKAADFIADLEKWWQLYCGLGVVKRVQAPPVLAISSRAFGFDHRDSLLPLEYSSLYLELKAKALRE
jgi:NAD+ synthase (glutamine-hydrolysing)